MSIRNFEVIYINLEKDVSKNANMQELCEKLGFNYRRHPGYDAVGCSSEYAGMVNLNFKDPYTNRNMTHGEFGCALAHIGVWSQIANSDKITLIFEDDTITHFDIPVVRGIIKDAYNLLALDGYELCYLGRQPLQAIKESGIEVAPGFIKPRYSWLTHAYMITPSAAKKLLIDFFLASPIPADEWIPYAIGEGFDGQLLRQYGEPATEDRINAIAYKDSCLFEQNRNAFGSVTESSQQFFLNDIDPATINYALLTIATDPAQLGFRFLIHSCAYHGWAYAYNIGDTVKWTGGTMEGPGGGQKVNILRDHINATPTMKDTDVLIFVDGYDVIVHNNPYNVIRAWLENFDTSKVTFAAEKQCWPDSKNKVAQIAKNQGGTNNHFLNSGCFIGTVAAIKKIISEPINNSDDDQRYYQKVYTDTNLIELDHQCKIFQCLGGQEVENNPLNGTNGTYEVEIDPLTGVITNSQTGTQPMIIHGNGDETVKNMFLMTAQTIENIRNPQKFMREI